MFNAASDICQSMPTYVNRETPIVFAKLLILYSARALTKYFSVCTCPTGVSLYWPSCPGLSLLHSFHTSWSAWGSESAKNVDFWQLTFVVVITGPLDFSAIKLRRACMRNSLNLTSSGADDYTRMRTHGCSARPYSHYKKGQEWVYRVEIKYWKSLKKPRAIQCKQNSRY